MVNQSYQPKDSACWLLEDARELHNVIEHWYRNKIVWAIYYHKLLITASYQLLSLSSLLIFLPLLPIVAPRPWQYILL